MEIPVEQMPAVFDELLERVRMLAGECAAWKVRALAAERELGERRGHEPMLAAQIAEPEAAALDGALSPEVPQEPLPGM